MKQRAKIQVYEEENSTLLQQLDESKRILQNWTRERDLLLKTI